MPNIPLRHEQKYFINEMQQDLVASMLNIEGVHDATLVACQTEAGA